MVAGENVPVLGAEGLGGKGYDGSNSPSNDSENNVYLRVGERGPTERKTRGLSTRNAHPSLQLLECFKFS